MTTVTENTGTGTDTRIRAFRVEIPQSEIDARRGNHFAAWQEPELYTNELRAAFRSLR